MAARPRLSHLGIFVRDLDLIERFYCGLFGLVVTDRGVGKVFANRLVFLSGNAEQHHQLVLSTGRGAEAPSTVMQMSFMVDTLGELRTLAHAALEHGATGLIGLNHGNAWSVYFDDPEQNRVEIYVDTSFHTPQPCGEPLDLSFSDAAILSQTEALIAALPGSKPRSDFIAEMQQQLA